MKKKEKNELKKVMSEIKFYLDAMVNGVLWEFYANMVRAGIN